MGGGSLLSHYQRYPSSPRQPFYYGTFLSGADSTPCFPLNAQHLCLQPFPNSYLIYRVCVCVRVQVQVKSRQDPDLLHISHIDNSTNM